MRFRIDAQLPPALAKALAGLGHRATHVEALGMRAATDKQIWNYAVRTRCVLLTKDEDFASMRRLASKGPAIVWVRVGNTSTDALVRRLLPKLTDIVAAIEANESIIEVR